MNLFGKFVVVLWRFNLFFAQRASGIKSTAWQDKTTLKGTRARYVTQFWAILKEEVRSSVKENRKQKR